jgi:hypothetical protein
LRWAACRPVSPSNPLRLIDASMHTRQMRGSRHAKPRKKQTCLPWLVRGRIENVAKANNPGRQENTGDHGSTDACDRRAALIEAR